LHELWKMYSHCYQFSRNISTSHTPTYPHAQTHTHTRTHARTHACTRAHTHTNNTISVCDGIYLLFHIQFFCCPVKLLSVSLVNFHTSNYSCIVTATRHAVRFIVWHLLVSYSVLHFYEALTWGFGSTRQEKKSVKFWHESEVYKSDGCEILYIADGPLLLLDRVTEVRNLMCR